MRTRFIRFCGFNHVGRFLGRGGQGLLAKYVNSGFQRADRDRGVERIGGGDDDEIQFTGFLLEKNFRIRVDLSFRKGHGGGHATGFVGIGNRGDFHVSPDLGPLLERGKMIVACRDSESDESTPLAQAFCLPYPPHCFSTSL